MLFRSLTVLTASIERLGQSCASAAGANVMKLAHAMAPQDMRNDIATSLEWRRSSDRLRWPRFFVGHVGRRAAPPDLGAAVHRHGRMMLPIGARGQPAARALRSCVARAPNCLFLSRPSLAKIADLERPRRPSQGARHFTQLILRDPFERPVSSPRPMSGERSAFKCVTTV